MSRNQIAHLWVIKYVAISGLILLSGSCFYLISYGDDINDPFIPVNSSFEGKPYKYWTAKWWEWNLSFNSTLHPMKNLAPDICSKDQPANSSVFFLVQPSPGDYPQFEEICTVSRDKAIITALQSGDCNYGYLEEQGLPKNDAQLLDCAERGNDNTRIRVTVDGKEYPRYDKDRRVLSDFFNIYIPEDNIMQYKKDGTHRAVVDGWYIFLKPLTPGKHVINYSFDTYNPRVNSLQNGTWHLTVN